MNKNTGITLIALVITIIVMLILVGVTINMAVNGGLFEYAGEAASETKSKMEEEKAIGNIREGMSTDELIGEITTNKEEDLAKLKEYFIGKGLDDIIEADENGEHYKDTPVIPDASTSIKNAVEFTSEYIKYHNRTYELIYLSENEIGDVEDVTGYTCVIGRVGRIKFIPKEGETWYTWATDETNTDDVIMVEQGSPQLSLKEVILSSYEENGENACIYYAHNRQGYSAIIYTLDKTFINNNCYCNNIIEKNKIYLVTAMK